MADLLTAFFHGLCPTEDQESHAGIRITLVWSDRHIVYLEAVFCKHCDIFCNVPIKYGWRGFLSCGPRIAPRPQHYFRHSDKAYAIAQLLNDRLYVDIVYVEKDCVEQSCFVDSVIKRVPHQPEAIFGISASCSLNGGRV